MYDAFVGLLTQRGLESLLPESDGARFRIFRRVRRAPAACGVWYVVERTVALAADELIQADECHDAQRLVEVNAREGGILLPLDAMP